MYYMLCRRIINGRQYKSFFYPFSASASVQDLRPEVIYKLHMVSSTEAVNICAGTIVVDSRGKGEIKIEFDPTNFHKSGVPARLFDVAAVIVPHDSEVKSVLVGYKNDTVMWKNNFFPPQKAADKPEESKTVNVPKEIVEVTELEDCSDTIGVAETEANSVVTEIAEEEIKTEALQEPEPAPPGLEIHEAFKQMAQTFRKEVEELGGTPPAPHTPAPAEGIDGLFETNRRMKPFERQNKDVTWVRISTNDFIHLPMNLKISRDDPFILDAEDKYKHLILGCFSENGSKYYILGIPAKFGPESRQHLMQKGFVQFKCCADLLPQIGEPGYYLMPL
jgi:hypothetical protein